MTRIFVVATLLAGITAFAQLVPKENQPNGKNVPAGTLPPEFDPDQGTPEQKCQATCAASMQKCMMPCMGGDPNEAAKPENRGKTMACVKKCGDSQEPCMKKCDALKDKSKKPEQ